MFITGMRPTICARNVTRLVGRPRFAPAMRVSRLIAGDNLTVGMTIGTVERLGSNLCQLQIFDLKFHSLVPSPPQRPQHMFHRSRSRELHRMLIPPAPALPHRAALHSARSAHLEQAAVCDIGNGLGVRMSSMVDLLTI